MLTLHRRPGESAMIEDDLEIAVEKIEGRIVHLRATWAAGVTRAFTLGWNDSFHVDANVTVYLIHLQPSFARLGFRAPRRLRILRTECWKENHEAKLAAV